MCHTAVHHAPDFIACAPWCRRGGSDGPARAHRAPAAAQGSSEGSQHLRRQRREGRPSKVLPEREWRLQTLLDTATTCQGAGVLCHLPGRRRIAMWSGGLGVSSQPHSVVGSPLEFPVVSPSPHHPSPPCFRLPPPPPVDPECPLSDPPPSPQLQPLQPHFNRTCLCHPPP